MGDSIECPRCGEEHEPSGNSEDAGEWECEACGFKFIVEIEYEPIYSSRCKEHDYGEWQAGSDEIYRVCKHCVKCEIKESING